jgi:hypothetical protein
MKNFPPAREEVVERIIKITAAKGHTRNLLNLKMSIFYSLPPKSVSDKVVLSGFQNQNLTISGERSSFSKISFLFRSEILE